MLTDQAIQELTSSVDKMKEELARSRRDAERWRAKAEAAGLVISSEETMSEAPRPR